MDDKKMETDFQRDFITILALADVKFHKDWRFILRNFMPDEPVDSLNLSVRAENSLKRSGVKTFGQLVKHELHKIRGCGVGTIKEIRTKFLSYVYDTYNSEQRKRFWKESIEATEQKFKEEQKK